TAAAASPSLAPALLPSARQPPQTPLPPAAPYRPHSSLAVASSNLAGTAAGGKRHLEQLLGDADLLQGRHSGRSAAKDMLISYVRAEAAHVAVVLKEKLTALGCSVFLDVDEIALGSDWQDALNDAVAATEVFIPLVTPRYGATQWTNREVKLADVLGKEILPISFISDWPPRCLAIQFATTQFVPWSGAYDIESANINDEAGRVAEEIRRQFDANKRRPPESESDERGSAMGPPSFKRKPTCLSIMSRKSIKFRQSNYHADDFAKADQLRSALVNRNFKVSVFAISCSVRCSTEVGGGSQEAAAAGTSDAAVAAAPAAASGAGGGDSAGSQGSSIGMR
uniref:TIR domain-containing protein n=1 Tax=Macrostomum lignano TaxID=282301 RepID=A0A1I8IH81_9PLAT